jgi:dTDP-4-amino-4,6-dideoxygalactose transaminase
MPEWAVPLSDLAVDDELRTAALEALDSGWWSMGPRVQEFERTFADLCETEHAIAVANGTTALHLALVACGCGTGDEVVLPSLNFVAAANSIAHTGATPVFCDVVGEHDLNLDPADLEAAIGPRTKALLVLHYGGFPCDMRAVREVADRHGIEVIEDAAHAPGATLDGRKCGSMGRVGCFSFFSNKNLAIGEGGMIVTSDDDAASRMRLLRSHGMTTLTWDRQRGHAHSYDVVAQGFNYRLDELRAAIGLVQLRRLEETNAARAGIVAAYRERLHGIEGIIMPFDGARGTPAHHLAVVVLPEGAQRMLIQQAMREQRVQTSVHYPPIHQFAAYAEGSQRRLPRTDALAGRILTLPLFAHMTEGQVETVCDALTRALQTVDERV